MQETYATSTSLRIKTKAGSGREGSFYPVRARMVKGIKKNLSRIKGMNTELESRESGRHEAAGGGVCGSSIINAFEGANDI